MSNSNTTFKVYSDQPVRQGAATVLNGLTSATYSPYKDLNFETQVSGQFTEYPGPKHPDDILATFDADDANLPSSGPAALISIQDYDLLAFDDSSIESAHFDGVMPENYTGRNIQVRIGWTSVAEAGNVMWHAALARLNEDNTLFGTSYSTSVSGVDAAPNASGTVQEMLLQLSDANLNDISKVEDYRLRVRRIGDNGLDTLSGDAYLLNVSLEELY